MSGPIDDFIVFIQNAAVQVVKPPALPSAGAAAGLFTNSIDYVVYMQELDRVDPLTPRCLDEIFADFSTQLTACYKYFLPLQNRQEINVNKTFLEALNHYLSETKCPDQYATKQLFNPECKGPSKVPNEATYRANMLNGFARAILTYLNVFNTNSIESPVAKKQRRIIFENDQSADQRPDDPSFFDVLAMLMFTVSIDANTNYAGLERLLKNLSFVESFKKVAGECSSSVGVKKNSIAYKVGGKLIKPVGSSRGWMSFLSSSSSSSNIHTNGKEASAPPEPIINAVPVGRDSSNEQFYYVPVIYVVAVSADQKDSNKSFEKTNTDASFETNNSMTCGLQSASSALLSAEVDDFIEYTLLTVKDAVEKTPKINSFEEAEAYNVQKQAAYNVALTNRAEKTTEDLEKKLSSLCPYFSQQEGFIEKRKFLAHLNLYLKPLDPLVDSFNEFTNNHQRHDVVHVKTQSVPSVEAREIIELNTLSSVAVKKLECFNTCTISTPVDIRLRGPNPLPLPPTFFEVLIKLMLDERLQFSDCDGLARLKEFSLFKTTLLAVIEASNDSAETIRASLAYRVAATPRSGSSGTNTKTAIDQLLKKKEREKVVATSYSRGGK